MRWDRAAWPDFLVQLKERAGYPSDTQMAKAIGGITQQHISKWGKATRRPTTLEAFLRRYAARHDVDAEALVEKWEFRPAAADASAPAEATASGQVTPQRLEAFAARLANSSELAEIRRIASRFWTREWIPLEQAVMKQASRQVDDVVAGAEAELARLKDVVVKLWRAERGRQSRAPSNN